MSLTHLLLALVVATGPGLAAPARQGFADVEGGKLFYVVSGSGPAVVLIHGGLLDRRQWDPQVKALEGSFTVVRYDVAGHGQSSVPASPWRDHEHLCTLLQHLGVGEASLVGLSMGGRIAVDFALAHPEMVRSLVLVGPGLSGFPFTARDWGGQIAPLQAAMQAGDTSRTVECFMRSWTAGPHRTPAQVDQKVWATVREMALPNAAHMGEGEPLQPPAALRLDEIHAPTLVVVGQLDCEDIHRIARLVERRVPGARKAVIPGAAHLPGLEKPAELNRLLLEFLTAPAPAPATASPLPHEEGLVEVGGARVWADSTGEGEAVLLIHDGIVHSVLWDELLPTLALEHRVIRFDRRGYGRSPAAAAPYSSLEDIAAVLRHFKVERAHLVGSSRGGGLAIEYALDHPEQVASLTLVGPVVSGLPLTRHLGSRGGRLQSEVLADPARLATYFTTTDPFYIAAANQAVRDRVAVILRGSPGNLARHELDRPPAHTALPRLGSLEVPTVVVAGEADIPDVHAHCGAIAAALPDARRQVVAGAGHALPLERPDELLASLLVLVQDAAFLGVLDREGPAAAAARLAAARAANPAAVLVDEATLNGRGHALLGADRAEEAVAVLRLAAQAYPASANAHDSLGEALERVGDRAAALAAYRRALEADPTLQSSRDAVARLGRTP